VATFSTILGLKLNDPTDPFQLSDFTANWELLDASPGIYICSSTTRPNWGPNQAGRFIFMNDLKCTSYWDGTGWNDELQAAPLFANGHYLNQSCGQGSTTNINTLTFTTSRPSAIAVFMIGIYNWVNTLDQDWWQSIMFDGVKQIMGNFREQGRAAGDRTDNGHTAGMDIPSMALIPSVAAGSHTIGIEVEVGPNYTTPITLIGVKTLAFVATFNSGNVL
jgi:hypothetical protein